MLCCVRASGLSAQKISLILMRSLNDKMQIQGSIKARICSSSLERANIEFVHILFEDKYSLGAKWQVCCQRISVCMHPMCREAGR